MKAEQIDQALKQKFITENERLVFWHDQNAEFADYIVSGLSGELEVVNLLEVAKLGGLSCKLHLEREDRQGKYLVYTTGKEPPPEEDWLLDIRLYSAQFHADVASVWSQELGLNGLYLRDHLKARAAFLNNQDRRKKLKRLISADDNEYSIDMKMMAVLAGSQVANPFSLLHAICQSHTQDDCFDLNLEPQIIEGFEKMGLAARFWEVMQREFGYADESPSISGLLRRLFVSELLSKTAGTRIDALEHFSLPAAGKRNAVVCLTQWRDSSGQFKSYDAAATALASELKIADHLGECDVLALANVFTFWEVEKRIVAELRNRVFNEEETVDATEINAIATDRKSGHWLAGPGAEKTERSAISDAYDAIVAAAELFSLHVKHRRSLSFDTPKELLLAYQNELYQFDRQYRRFCTKAKSAHNQGWDLLKNLSEKVEQVYDQGFLQPLGFEWSRLLDEGFLEKWALDSIPCQRTFYANQIQPYLNHSDRKRAFVIISDAFRYEAACELVENLNSRYRMNAELSAMLGSLPSYTALGMASLLPHKSLDFNDKGEVLLDGSPVTGTSSRSKKLGEVNGMACQAKNKEKDILAMKQEEAREFFKGKRVVYIYHNVIDARGEHATEGETFQAVSACIDELAALVQFCINTLNAAKVWVTADHGFLFQQSSPRVPSALCHESWDLKRRWRPLGSPGSVSFQRLTVCHSSSMASCSFRLPDGSSVMVIDLPLTRTCPGAAKMLAKTFFASRGR